MKLKAPFPYFGGKSDIAGDVWDAFGDVTNYTEPFFGSGAVLLARPHEAKIETVNDLDGFLVNFWRALQADPEAVTHWADYPVSEIDLYARHGWLVNRKERLAWALEDPDYFDPKIAGWWVWGLSCWIGSGWCSGHGPWVSNGAHIMDSRKTIVPNAEGGGIHRQLPHLRNAGMGIHRKRPHLGNTGNGIHRQRPHLSYPQGVQQNGLGNDALLDYFIKLSDRLRKVRICCGDWTRILAPSPTTKLGVTAVFLDPPYSTEAGRDMELYAKDCGEVAHAVREWAIAHGDDPMFRIALCGYDTEHDMPEDWRVLHWKSRGGLGSIGNGRGRENSSRETVWFSPHCIENRNQCLPGFE